MSLDPLRIALRGFVPPVRPADIALQGFVIPPKTERDIYPGSYTRRRRPLRRLRADDDELIAAIA